MPHEVGSAIPTVRNAVTAGLTTSSAGDESRHYRPGWPAVVSGFILIAYVAIMVRASWPFTTDDAYITLRYAQHLAEGHGVVWNIGEQLPVEGYSNFLYVPIAACALKLGANPVVVLKICGVLGLLLSCVVLYLLARTWLPPVSAILAPLVFLSYSGVIWWAVSGLETPVYIFWTAAAVLAFILGLGYRPNGLRRPLSLAWMGTAGLLVFLASLTRPEGPVAGLAMALILCVRLLRAKVRSYDLLAIGALAATFAVPFAVYFAWRWGHFHRFFPNTYYVKKAVYHGDPWSLIIDFYRFAWLLLLPVFIYPLRRWDARHGVLLTILGFYTVLLYGVDPIVGHYHRHFLCAFGLMGPLIAVGLQTPIIKFFRPHVRYLGQQIYTVTLALLLLLLACTIKGPNLHSEAVFYARRMNVRYQLGLWLGQHIQTGEAYVIGDCGLVPYLTPDAQVIDAFFLNTIEMTRLPIKGSVARFVDWVFRQQPRYIIVHGKNAPDLVPHEFYGVFPAIVGDQRFNDEYRFTFRFGGSDDNFHYFVYERHP